jgi:alpha-galactosidase
MPNTATDNEMALAARWAKRLFDSSLPLSFSYDGKQMSGNLEGFRFSDTPPAAPAGKSTLLCRDEATGLKITADITCYPDFPCVEWVFRLKNEGSGDTPIIEGLQALDMLWEADGALSGGAPDPAVRYACGTHADIDDFRLMEQALEPGAAFSMATKGGKSSAGKMPFFNIRWGAQGVIAMIGWSGQWAAKIAREGEDGRLRLSAGLERTHFRLHPGEEVRTPSIALLFWTGEIARSHNLLRRFLVRHHSPAPGGRPVSIPVSCMAWGGMKAANHLRNIGFIRSAGLPYTNYWIDAGWFGPPHDAEEFQQMETEDWYGLVGDWRVNSAIHPQGLKPVSDAAHAAGMTFLLWIEPERAVQGTPVALEHPEWLIPLPLGVPRYDVGKYEAVESLLFNLGIPEARRWVTDFVSERIRSEGVDVYRQDMNTWQTRYWESCDAPDRVGVTEMKYIEGLYAFLDGLLEKHPGLLIDNCAGGGSRLDIEMMGRSVCLHRTDYVCWPGTNPMAGQAQGVAVMHWIPYSCTGSGDLPGDTYRFRSGMSGGVNLSITRISGSGDVDVSIPQGYDGAWHRKMLQEHALIRELFAADFYALTECDLSPKSWHAFQLDSPELGRGAVVAFRREESPFTSACFPLQGLEQDSEYEIENVDTGETALLSGRALEGEGLALEIPSRRDSRIMLYRKRAGQTQ